MKTLMKTITIAAIACGMIMVVYAFVLKKPAAQSVDQDMGNSDSRPFPELLVRNEALKQTAEWESNVHRVSALSSRLIHDPQDAEALTELAHIYCIEARVTGEHGYYFPAVLNMLDQVLSQNNLNEKSLIEATTLKANVLLSQHRFHEGLIVAEKAHAMNPYSTQAFAALIDANVELGNYERAVELTDQMMNVRPGLEAYARASYLRELHGDLEGAIDAMRMAVEAGYPGYENTEWTRVALAELYEKTGDREMAERTYRISMQLRENNPFAQGGLARILTDKGQFAEAEAIFKSALEAVPEIGFQEDLFRLYKAWGKEQEANAAFTGIIEMIEDDAAHGHKVDLDYAKILVDLKGDVKNALPRVLSEYQDRPDNIEVNKVLAQIYAAEGKVELAKLHYEKAVRTGYTSPELSQLKTTLS